MADQNAYADAEAYEYYGDQGAYAAEQQGGEYAAGGYDGYGGGGYVVDSVFVGVLRARLLETKAVLQPLLEERERLIRALLGEEEGEEEGA